MLRTQKKSRSTGTTLGYLISHPRIQESKAVIIATIDNQLIVDELNALDPTLGRSILHQHFTTSSGREKVVDVAIAGTADTEEYTQLRTDQPHVSIHQYD